MSDHIRVTNKKVGVSTEKHAGITKDYVYIFNSTLADFKNDNGNEFRVHLYSPIVFPNDLTGVKLALYRANIWNSVPNIIGSGDTKNNTLAFIYDGNAETIITIPQGNYTLCTLQSAINDELEKLYNLKDMIFLQGDEATSKINIQFNFANTQINFANSLMSTILGFNPTLQPATPQPAGDIIYASNVAQFAGAVSSFLIQAPVLVNDGMKLNSRSSGIVGQVPITAPSNSIIAYETASPIWIQNDALIGTSISQLTFKLTNELLQDVIMPEPFNFTIIMRIEF